MDYEKTEKQKRHDRGKALSGCMVSVSCISFNHVRYIEKALDSFLMQETDFEFEILIHDDASTDGTEEIIKDYVRRFPDIIKPVFEKENQYSRGISNISGVFNFPRAKGKYIAMCEGDDYWCDPYKLQKQYEIMEADESLSLCCHAAAIEYGGNAFKTEDSIRPYTKSGRIEPERFISRKSNIPTASMFFRAEYAKTLPKWYFDCPVGDIPLQLYMAANGGIYYIDEIMSVYRQDAVGSWQSGMDEGRADKVKEKWEAHFKAINVMYDAFDKDTKGRWTEAVREAVNRQRFHIDLKEENAKAVLKKENAVFLNELPKTEIRLQKLKAKAPWVYDILKHMYFLLKN